MNLAIGDESTPGFDPKNLNNRTKSTVLSKALHEKTIIKGMRRASLTIKGKNSLLHQLHQFSLPAYDRIFLFYGANDYLYSKCNLEIVSKRLNQSIAIIRKKNKWIKIYGILPLPMYDKNDNSLASKRGPGYYTLHDLINMLNITYINNEVKTLNWMTLTNPIINKNNYKNRLIAGRYPTKQTYKLMADRISTIVKN